MDDAEEIGINGKRIFICEEHHHVLKFWSEFKEKKPYVLTFDHHTDLHRAFQGKLNNIKFLRGITTQKEWDDVQHELLVDLISNDFNSIDNLKHDEHIDAALKLGFLNKVLVYSYDSYQNRPDRVYCINGNEKYSGQLVINNSRSYGDDDNVINSTQLIQNFNLFDLCIPKEHWIDNFILDIDLDFFKTCNSIKPHDISFFKTIIDKSIAISIAKETLFVNSWKKEYDNEISVKYLLHELIKIIER